MLKNPENSYFATCQDAETILEIVRKNLGVVPKAQIYEKVKSVDPNVPEINSFYKFVKTIDEERRARAMAVLETMRGTNNLTEEELVNTALNGLMGLGNVVIRDTLEEAKQTLESGKPLPEDMKKQIMNWFFKAADTKNKADLNKIKNRATDALVTVVDNLMTAARYQKLKGKDDVVEGEFEEKELIAELEEERDSVYDD